MVKNLQRWFVGLLGVALCASSLPAQDSLTGEIKIDGSSTVYLVSKQMADNFRKTHGKVSIPIGVSGTGGGFKKFAQGETDISGASRAIKSGEADKCKEAKIEFLELQVAWDGLAIVIHPENSWAKNMTLQQLKKIWHPDSAAKKWKDVDPSWPDEAISLFGAGSDSGTFDYFTEAVVGKERLIRADYSGSEDDNVTVVGVSGNKFAMGFLGVAYYDANKTKLGVVHLTKDGKAFHAPTKETVLAKTYPLSRPLFIYIKKTSLARPEVKAFAEFFLRRADLVEDAKYFPLDARQQLIQRDELEEYLSGK